MYRPFKSVTHGQCDARSTVTFPVAGHRCHLAYCETVISLFVHCIVSITSHGQDIAAVRLVPNDTAW